MSTSAVTAVSPAASEGLVKTASGDYTAASVAAHPNLASGLVRTKDGNYAEPIVAASDRYTAVAADLTTLRHGG